MSQSQNHHHQNHQNQPHQQLNPIITTTSSTSTTTWMWNPREHQEEEDNSWEVRAFAEDTNNIMGTTWPPRSYTCTFCRREFRSAQALGGHMNVHRRDRARLHHPPPPTTTTTITSPSFINVPPHDLVANDGLCLLYHLTSPNTNYSAPFNTTLNACSKSPSANFLNVSSYPPNSLGQRSMHNIVKETAQIKGKDRTFLSLERIHEDRNTRQTMSNYSNTFDFTMARVASNCVSSSCYRSSSKVEEPTNISTNHGHNEELDLELRLGHKSTPT